MSRSKGRRIRESRCDRVFYVLNFCVATFFLLVTLYPLIYVVSASFSSPLALSQGRVWLWPVDITLDGYSAIFTMPSIMRGYLNSALYTVLGTSINVVMTVMAAYPLARRTLFGRGVFMFLFVFTMMFGGGLVPSYLLVRDLHMINTVWALVIPGALSVWNMTITMNFFRSNIPEEMLEAAQLDGCSDARFLLTFVIPLSKSILAVIALFYAVSHWNSYFNAMLYLNDAEKFPLQLVLRDVLVQNSISNTSQLDIQELMKKQNAQDLLRYSIIVVSTLPMMLVYPLVQKYLVKGVMVGSLKG